MKSNSLRLDRNRLYEITVVPTSNAWSTPHKDDYSILGAIVRPTAEASRFRVFRPGKGGFLSSAVRRQEGCFFGPNLTLRPLNRRDQKKIMHQWDQLCLEKVDG